MLSFAIDTLMLRRFSSRLPLIRYDTLIAFRHAAMIRHVTAMPYAIDAIRFAAVATDCRHCHYFAAYLLLPPLIISFFADGCHADDADDYFLRHAFDAAAAFITAMSFSPYALIAVSFS